MSTRRKPDNRRRSFIANLRFEGHLFVVTSSRYADGQLCEIFIDARKPGSGLQATCTALGRVASLYLQREGNVDELMTVGGLLAAAIEISVAP